MRLTGTHTFAELGLTPAAYDEIADKLRAADYGHAFMPDGAIDMHGIGITRKESAMDEEKLTTEEEAAVRRLLTAVKRWWTQPVAEGPDPALDEVIDAFEGTKAVFDR